MKVEFTYKIVTLDPKSNTVRDGCYGVVTYPGEEFSTGIFTTNKDIAKVVCKALEEYAVNHGLGAGWFLLHNVNGIIRETKSHGQGKSGKGSRSKQAPKRDRRNRKDPNV